MLVHPEYYTFGPCYEWNGVVHKQWIRCYLLMGSSFVKVDSVPAGHICAVYNLEQLQLKTVTLCDKIECMPLRGFAFGLQPLVKINVEPVLASGELDTQNHIICTSHCFTTSNSTASDHHALTRILKKRTL